MSDMLKLQEFFEGCHNADVCSGIFTKIWRAKRRPRKMTRPRNLVAKTGTDSPTVSTIETDKMIASTITILHAKNARAAIATETTNLVMMTKVMPRLRKSTIT
jgi:hypothetical protein